MGNKAIKVLKYLNKGKIMKGFLLLLIAWILILPATLLNVILVASKAKHRGWVYWLSGYFQRTARNIDVFGADELITLWNTILVKKNGIQFKGDGRTISFYLGANQLNNTLTWLGKFIAWICDTLDKHHCYNAYIKELK